MGDYDGGRRVRGDIAQLVQLGEITTRAGGSSAAAGKRNPIDAMRAMAVAEACVGIATVEAVGAAPALLEVEPSALVVADDRRNAAEAFVTSVLEQSP